MRNRRLPLSVADGGCGLLTLFHGRGPRRSDPHRTPASPALEGLPLPSPKVRAGTRKEGPSPDCLPRICVHDIQCFASCHIECRIQGRAFSRTLCLARLPRSVLGMLQPACGSNFPETFSLREDVRHRDSVAWFFWTLFARRHAFFRVVVAGKWPGAGPRNRMPDEAG